MSSTRAPIVAGIDGSVSSMKALDWAAEQAAAEQRPLLLAHALGDATAAWSDLAGTDAAGTRALMEREGWELLDSLRDRVLARFPDLDVEQRVELADPRRLLLRAASGASLVVLGSRGLGPLRSLLLGSVGSAVVRHASCPVVVHRPAHPGLVRNGVLVATDVSEHARPVLEFAFELASSKRLPLTVMHCLWDVETITRRSYDLSAPDLEPERLELAEAVAGMSEKYPDVHVTRVLVPGPPEKVVIEAAERMDVLVVGADQGSRLDRMIFGSTSRALVEHAPCPVAVVPVSAPEPA